MDTWFTLLSLLLVLADGLVLANMESAFVEISSIVDGVAAFWFNSSSSISITSFFTEGGASEVHASSFSDTVVDTDGGFWSLSDGS